MIPTNPPADTQNNPQTFPVHRASAILQAPLSTSESTPRSHLSSLRTSNNFSYRSPKTQLLFTSLTTKPKSPEMATLFDYVKSLPAFMGAAATSRVAAPLESSPAVAQLRLPLPSLRRTQAAGATKQKAAQPPVNNKTASEDAADFRLGIFS